MVQLFSQDKKNPKTFRGFSYPTYLDIRAQNTVFTDVTCFNLALVGLGQKGDTRRGSQPSSAQTISQCSEFPWREVVCSCPRKKRSGVTHRSRSSAIVTGKTCLDPGVLGSQLLINGRAFTIVGITPKGFTGTMQVFSADAWLPMSVYDRVANDFASENKTTIADRKGNQLLILGRLKSGMTAAAAEPALEGLAANLEKAFPVEQKNQTFITEPVSRNSVSTSPSGDGGMVAIGPLLLGMATVVLLVACLNLANMLLARGRRAEKKSRSDSPLAAVVHSLCDSSWSRGSCWRCLAGWAD